MPKTEIQKSPSRRKYKPKWVPLTKDELRDTNVGIYGSRRGLYYKRGFKRSCLGSSVLVVTLSRRYSWDHYLLLDGIEYTESRVELGGTLKSWENLVFRDAVTKAKKFFDRIGRLEL